MSSISLPSDTKGNDNSNDVEPQAFVDVSTSPFEVTIPTTVMGDKQVTIYKVLVTFADGWCWSVPYRYSDFEKLHEDLCKIDTAIKKLQLPPKTYLSRFNTTVIEERKQIFTKYLQSLTSFRDEVIIDRLRKFLKIINKPGTLHVSVVECSMDGLNSQIICCVQLLDQDGQDVGEKLWTFPGMNIPPITSFELEDFHLALFNDINENDLLTVAITCYSKTNPGLKTLGSIRLPVATIPHNAPLEFWFRLVPPVGEEVSFPRAIKLNIYLQSDVHIENPLDHIELFEASHTMDESQVRFELEKDLKRKTETDSYILSQILVLSDVDETEDDSNASSFLSDNTEEYQFSHMSYSHEKFGSKFIEGFHEGEGLTGSSSSWNNKWNWNEEFQSLYDTIDGPNIGDEDNLKMVNKFMKKYLSVVKKF